MSKKFIFFEPHVNMSKFSSKRSYSTVKIFLLAIFLTITFNVLITFIAFYINLLIQRSSSTNNRNTTKNSIAIVNNTSRSFEKVYDLNVENASINVVNEIDYEYLRNVCIANGNINYYDSLKKCDVFKEFLITYIWVNNSHMKYILKNSVICQISAIYHSIFHHVLEQEFIDVVPECIKAEFDVLYLYTKEVLDKNIGFHEKINLLVKKYNYVIRNYITTHVTCGIFPTSATLKDFQHKLRRNIWDFLYLCGPQ
ncbi:hypothetical protein EDEG_03885, partial [Edhazardia aedis USNM 41457]